MIFSFQQYSMTGGIIVYPDFPFSNLPNTKITENPVVVGGAPGGATVNITGSIGRFFTGQGP